MKSDMISFVYAGKKVNFVKPKKPDYITEKIDFTRTFYEIELLEWLEKQTYRKGIFVDIGANIGNHTVFFSKILSRETWSFEPYKPAYDSLQANILANDLNNVTLFNIGLSDSDSFGDMQIQDTGNIGTATVTRLNKSKGSIQLKSGDEILKNAKSISLIKIDVEGFEINVLNGIKRAIEKHSPSLLVECMHSAEFTKIINFLEPLNYAPRAVFGATPMILFERDIYPIEASSDLTVFNMNSYLQLNDAYMHTRNMAQHSESKMRNLDRLLEENNKKVVYYKESLNNSKQAILCIQSSPSYKIGRLITLPLRLLRNLMNLK